MNFQNNAAAETERRFIFLALAIMAMLALGMIVSGCTTTLKPVKTEARSASFDSGGQNSGFLGFTNIPGAGSVGIITPHARDRYNALIALYGKKFIPPLVQDAGLAPVAASPNWTITSQALVNFATMNRWRKESK